MERFLRSVNEKSKAAAGEQGCIKLATPVDPVPERRI
jgi:hypothetical protein